MFLCVVALAGCEAQASSPVKLAPAGEVQSVAIDTPRSPRDERRLPLAELRGLLTTKPGDLIDEAKLEADRSALREALVARGFLAATVSAPSITTGKNGGAYVVFDVERGPMFHLRSITVTGPGESNAHVVRLSAGDEAVRSRIERAQQSLGEVLANRSTKSRVELRVHEDPATASVDVELATTEITVLRR